MIVTPIKRLRPRAVGIVTRDGVVAENGKYDIADTPKGTVLYALNHSEVWAVVRSGRGRARMWRKRYTKYEIDGNPIHSPRDAFTGLDAGSALESLITVRNWVESHGANLSSFGGTAHSLWRASLKGKVLIASSRTPVPSEFLHLGGRQEAFPDVYERAELWDIRSAYVSAMRELFVGARYRHYSRAGGFELRYPNAVGFARATVHRPYRRKNAWGYLPVKSTEGRTVFPVERIIEGLFDLQELRAVHKLGVRVEIHEAWIAHGLRLPWKNWAAIIEDGRQLDGVAGNVVKGMSNTLWGTFATSGKGTWVRYVDGRLVTEPDEKEHTGPARAVAAHVAAYLRARLLLESLYFNDRAAVSAHTDGVILLPGAHPVRRIGDDVGDWVYKGSINNLTLLSPSLYSYDNDEGMKQYVVAGTPKQYRAKVFSQMIRRIPNLESKLVEYVP